MRDVRRGMLMVAVAGVLWSLGGLLVRLIGQTDWTLIFWRSLFAAAFLGAYLVVAGRGRSALAATFRQLGLPGLTVSVFLSLDTILFIFALNRTSVANVVFIFATTPFVAALLAWVAMREPVARATWGAMFACLAGVGLMVSGSIGTSSIVGDGLAMVVAVLFAVPVVIIRKHPHIRMLPAIFLAAAITTAVSLPMALLSGIPARDYGLMAIFGVVEFGLASVLYAAGARYIPAAQTTLIGLLETALAPIWVWTFVGENPGGRTLAGGAVVLVTLGALAVSDARRPRAGVPPVA